MLGLVRGLAHSGAITAIVISHKLKEVAKFADEVTVLRRGRRTGGGPAPGLTPADMTAMMIGEPQAPAEPERLGAPDPAPRLELRGVTTAGDQGRAGLAIESLTVRPREIVGIAGVSGNGQATLVEVLGGQRAPSGGQVLVEGAPYDGSRDLAQARAVRVLPEEPLRNGCVPRMSVAENLNLRGFDRDAGRRPALLARPPRHGGAGEAADRRATGSAPRPPRRRSACCPAATSSAASWRGSWTGRCAC